jgi:hypothetical protein
MGTELEDPTGVTFETREDEGEQAIRFECLHDSEIVSRYAIVERHPGLSPPRRASKSGGASR